MKVVGLKQENGRWVRHEHEVTMLEHLYCTLWVIFNYYKDRIVERLER